MSLSLFKSWNWEYDHGEAPLSPTDPLPRTHAIAFYDHAHRLYRVVMKNRRDIDMPHPSMEDDIDIFDYFCDEAGKILEKRALDDAGNVVLIVRFSYDEAKGLVTEFGWDPRQDGPPQMIVRAVRQ